MKYKGITLTGKTTDGMHQSALVYCGKCGCAYTVATIPEGMSSEGAEEEAVRDVLRHGWQTLETVLRDAYGAPYGIIRELRCPKCHVEEEVAKRENREDRILAVLERIANALERLPLIGATLVPQQPLGPASIYGCQPVAVYYGCTIVPAPGTEPSDKIEQWYGYVTTTVEPKKDKP